MALAIGSSEAIFANSLFYVVCRGLTRLTKWVKPGLVGFFYADSTELICLQAVHQIRNF